MQTYNNFNELASAQSASPLVTDMSIFNGDAETKAWQQNVAPLQQQLATIVAQLKTAQPVLQSLSRSEEVVSTVRKYANHSSNCVTDMLHAAEWLESHLKSLATEIKTT